MITSATAIRSPRVPERQEMLPAEADFYSAYDWCLDPHLTIREVIRHLGVEIDRLESVPKGWQIDEVATNVFLLSCALLNSIDEYLRGPTLRMPRQLAARRLGRGLRWMVEKSAGPCRRRHRAQVRRWKERWQDALDEFLAVFAQQIHDRASFIAAGRRLARTLTPPLPSELEAAHISVPSAFAQLDVTHFDILALGRRFIERFPDRSQPILLLGIRTGGTYFAALLRTFFKVEGYRMVSSLTVQVNKGAGRRERRELKQYAHRRYMALIVDDPPSTGSAVILAFDIARRAGFAPDQIAVVVPANPENRDWSKSLPIRVLVTLEPEQWHMRRLLDPKAVESRLTEYFRPPDFAKVTVAKNECADDLNVRLQPGKRGNRLKRIYEVRLQTARGQTETRYVLAKSVGLGWMGYRAFVAADRLSEFVPPILGLRDGILYMEWIPQRTLPRGGHPERDFWIETSASYVAARTRTLSLPKITTNGRTLQQHENGLRLLERRLSKAYGRFPTELLMWPRVRKQICQDRCPYPTLIDGKMARDEWIVAASGLLKTDFEHHGMGKAELNVKDPAYDLADIILTLALSPEDENRLIRHYAGDSGDGDVGRRLFMNKLLAGFWTMESARDLLLGEPQTIDRQQEVHRRYMNAWNFLTIHTARFCGTQFRQPRKPRWLAPLLMLDVDGVLDRRLFGYPSTTAAGIEALALLAARGFCVALNTARSAAEVRDYCDAYGLAGGVAENGAYLWDATTRQEELLIDPEALDQLEELRKTLSRVPGVFLDDRHKYSVRAFMYADQSSSMARHLVNWFRPSGIRDGVQAPLSTPLINHFMTSLRLDRLSYHHTTIDTTIVAKHFDKGTGLVALRDRILGPRAETIAMGDSETDLPMFRSATRSFAPSHIHCPRQAKLLGCEILRHPYQRGLLDLARMLVGSTSRQAAYRRETAATGSDGERLFLELLQAADRIDVKRLICTLFDPATFRMFVR